MMILLSFYKITPHSAQYKHDIKINCVGWREREKVDSEDPKGGESKCRAGRLVRNTEYYIPASDEL